MYIRSASQNKYEQARSIASQKQALQQCAEMNGYEIVDENSDKGHPGLTLDRPTLDQLRTDAKAKLFDCVIVYDPVRIARRYKLQIEVEDELKSSNIRLIYINPPRVDSNIGRLVAAVAQEVIANRMLTQK
jgi:site-specific DNA recombinase